MSDRLERLRQRTEEAGCDAFLSLSPPTNQYLTGFLTSFIEKSSAVIATRDEALFLCDSRYTEQAQGQVRRFAVEQFKGSMARAAGRRLASLEAKRVAFDPADLTVQESSQLQSEFRGDFEPLTEFGAALRLLKSPEEIEAIRAASALAEGVLQDLIGTLDAGASERETAARFEYEFKRRGADGASFDTVCLFGRRSSLPHGMPSEKTLEHGDLVLLDFGCRRNGYCSDLTRTYAYGTIPGVWFEDVYNAVLKAQQLALEVVRPGLRCRDLDAVARDVITEAGYGPQFGHGLGHGVGIEIHEQPRLNTESETILEPGMVVTIEPGIYLPGKGGVRIEDLVAVTETGRRLLSSSPKTLKVLGG